MSELKAYSLEVSEELQVYRMGMVHCSICTNIKDEKKIEGLVNLEYPTGISSDWQISKDPKFASGHSNPCPCEQKPETHKHYLMVC